jgi:acid phosphatase type 7
MATRKWLRLLVMPAFLAIACSGGNTTTPVTPTLPPTLPPNNPTPPSAPSVIAYLAGAGDIADCANDGGAHAEATARLLDNMPEATIFTAGDNAYFFGNAADYNNCYRPRWGRHLSRTHPSSGNHEYDSGTNGIPYFDYFGGRAGDRGAGFYSYTLGNWHIVSLNSNVGVSAGSEQLSWLRNDLVTNSRSATSKCTLAYWHHPLFTSGPSAGSSGLMREVWSVLYEFGADVIGHDHLYERYFAQDPSGLRGPAGIVEYIVGTGGAPLYEFGPTPANSAFRMNRSYGVIRFTLRDVGWDSVFIEAGTEIPFDPSPNNLCH